MELIPEITTVDLGEMLEEVATIFAKTSEGRLPGCGTLTTATSRMSTRPKAATTSGSRKQRAWSSRSSASVFPPIRHAVPRRGRLQR